MKSLREGVDYYLSENGYVVFTELYHKAKGTCCGNGCRHCPYDYEKVPEPRRTECLKKRIIFQQAGENR